MYIVTCCLAHFFHHTFLFGLPPPPLPPPSSISLQLWSLVSNNVALIANNLALVASFLTSLLSVLLSGGTALLNMVCGCVFCASGVVCVSMCVGVWVFTCMCISIYVLCVFVCLCEYVMCVCVCVCVYALCWGVYTCMFFFVFHTSFLSLICHSALQFVFFTALYYVLSLSEESYLPTSWVMDFLPLSYTGGDLGEVLSRSIRCGGWGGGYLPT